MTLGELAKAAKVNIFLIPSVLQNLEVENSDDFCRYRISRYLNSAHFKDDAITILNTLVKSTAPIKDFSMQFFEDALDSLHLRISCKIEESL